LLNVPKQKIIFNFHSFFLKKNSIDIKRIKLRLKFVRKKKQKIAITFLISNHDKQVNKKWLTHKKKS